MRILVVLTSIRYKQCLSIHVGRVNNVYYLLLFLCASSVPAVRMYSFHDYREKFPKESSYFKKLGTAALNDYCEH